jgi:DNA repair protein RadC
MTQDGGSVRTSGAGSDAGHDGAGHRARLRQRLREGGRDALLDHELIEYLLALAIPRRDTKPLARRLLVEFGSFGAVLSADWDALERVPGMGETSAAAIKAVQAAALRMLSGEIRKKPVLGNWQSLLDYLRADMAWLGIERVRVLHLNARNELLRDEAMGDGSIDQAAIYTREVIRRAMDLGSTSLILVHNHPSGDPSPSRQDIEVTRHIVDAGKRLGISVHDHIIIAANGHTSLRAQGLL